LLWQDCRPSPTAESISHSDDPDNRLVSALIGTGTPQYQSPW
jgi:hypothetical protein